MRKEDEIVVWEYFLVNKVELRQHFQSFYIDHFTTIWNNKMSLVDNFGISIVIFKFSIHFGG